METTQDDVYQFVTDFFTSGVLPKELNSTLIYLIPKVPSPEHAEQFHSISLCNTAVKVISKIFSDRLKSMLNDVISPYQSAFVPDRLISDNVFLAHEIFHYIKRQKRDKKKLLGIKLDMKKAYDRMEWPFIKESLIRMGFCVKWVELIMKCITSVSYSLLVNGVLSAIVAEAGQNQLVRGIWVRGRAPPISHLLFADECLMFSEVQLQEINHLQDCLEKYCKASGQEINLSKLTLTFSPNTPTKFKRWFSRILKIRYGDGPSKYLGLSAEIGISKAEVFKDITDRTCKRVQGWK
ncbi:uncharacterized protein LOC122658177 [Telopea speciosissima]|uniref:uncharacterized protein LOC122658177 n=1 Tax=Telopea speciosissima TaxID=54955 RepID=UPI001CC6E7D0|nr:uncharacterized protein LOC122658177 [Telopea speciosissima]